MTDHGKQDPGNPVDDVNANLPQVFGQFADQRHTQRPAELHRLDIFANSAPFTGRQSLQPFAYRFITAVGGKESNVQGGRVHGVQCINIGTPRQLRCEKTGKTTFFAGLGFVLAKS